MGRPWKAAAPHDWAANVPRGREPRSGVPRNFARVGALRAKILFYLLTLLGLGLVVRLYVVQIRQGPWLAAKARSQSLETIDLAATRGPIYDRDGNTLARSLPARSVYASLNELVDRPGEARSLAAALGMPRDHVANLLQGEHGYVLIARKVPRDAAQRVDKLDLAGINVVAEKTGVRYVPSGRFASTVLGFTGIDENGLEGIEYQYDDLLSGRPGRVSRESDQFGRALPFAQSHVLEVARPGYGLALTLDPYLQYNAERVLHETVARFHAASGTVIIMDPHTGELLALANAPDYDVNHFASASPDRRRDRAVADVYEPGSTFKLITAAAALDSGKVTMQDRFPARDRLTFGDYVIHNAEDGFLAGTAGSETLEDIVAYSHNVGAAEVALAIGSHTMARALHRFGFEASTHSGLPGEVGGLVDPVDAWSRTTLPTIAFGHGIAITPLALVRAYAAIANDGVMVRPRILNAVLDPSGGEAYRYTPEIERRVMTAKTAAALMRILRAVVTRGTGKDSAQIPGYTTAGKTGTAQVAERGRYVSGQYVASFIGFVPAEKPRFEILVKIERPRGAIYGGEVAAPGFAELAHLAMLHAGVLPALAAPPVNVRPVAAPPPAPPRSVNGRHASKHRV